MSAVMLDLPVDQDRRRCTPAQMTMTVSFCNIDNVGVNQDNRWGNRTDRSNGLIEMTSTRHKKRAGLAAASKGEVIAELMLEVAQCFFRIRALGQKTGLITSWGGGAFGFLRSL